MKQIILIAKIMLFNSFIFTSYSGNNIKKEGGIVIYEVNGHGFVICQEDFVPLNWHTGSKKRVISRYNDWELPSQDEAIMIFQSCNSEYGEKSLGIKTNDIKSNFDLYWTSSEGYNEDAFTFNINSGGQGLDKKMKETYNSIFDGKDMQIGCRPIRHY